MKKRITNKVTVKLILLNIVAFIVSTVVFISIGNVFVHRLFKKTGDRFIRTYNVYSIIIISIPIMVFLTIFILGINKRVKYLKYIINRVSNIHDDIYLDNISLNGNDELTELANSINIMSERLKENYEKEKGIEQSKNELIASVSHDLKTPLTSIIGYVELLKNETYNSDEEKKEYIDIIYNKSNRLNMLIKELFEYTQLDSSNIKLDLTKVDMVQFVHQLVGEHIYFFNEKNVKVEFEDTDKNIYCLCDVEKIIRVFDNVIKNAEKYCYENSVFKIAIKKEKSKVKISFQNQGENFSDEDLNKIFERFYRRDKARTDTNEGSGLGLAIAKKIIEIHDGDIWAESQDSTIKINILLNILDERVSS